MNQIKVVLPKEIDDLSVDPELDQMTLFTYTPYAVNTYRLMVRGHRVPYGQQIDEQQSQAADFRLEPWMWWLLGGVGVGLGTAVFIALREVQRKRIGQGRAEGLS